MLKRIPYNDRLIQIGNASHQAGSPVWSDGQVAYGRIRNSQILALQIAKLAGGFWVNEQGYPGWYKLCKDTLRPTGKINADAFGDVFAYPYYAIEGSLIHQGYIANDEKCCKYTGGLIYLDNTGHSISYDSSKIYFNSFSNTIKRDSHSYAVEMADAVFYDENDRQQFSLHFCPVAVNNDYSHLYFYDDNNLTTVSVEYDNGYIRSQLYTGTGTVKLSNKLWFYDTDTTVVDISMLESDDLLNPSFIFFDDGIISTNNNRITVDTNADYSSLKTAFQICKNDEIYAYVDTKTYDQHNLLMMYCIRIELRDMYSNVLWQGAGIVTEDTSTSKRYAYIIDAQGDLQQIAYYENQTLYYNSNTYPNGDLVKAGLSYPYLTNKHYKIFIPSPGTPQSYVQGDSGNPAYPAGLKEENYPNFIVIDGILTVNTSNFSASATIDGHNVTLTGDVFELSQIPSGHLSFPSGLHALMYKKNLYVICQSAKKIFRIDKNGSVLSASYNGIEDCFSLAYLIKRWNRRNMS